MSAELRAAYAHLHAVTEARCRREWEDGQRTGKWTPAGPEPEEWAATRAIRLAYDRIYRERAEAMFAQDEPAVVAEWRAARAARDWTRADRLRARVPERYWGESVSTDPAPQEV